MDAARSATRSRGAQPSTSGTWSIDEAEATELRQAAFDLLHGVSLAAVQRGLIARGVATVTGAPWSTRTIRDMLLKAAVVGQQVRAGELVEAPWEGILSQATQVSAQGPADGP